MHPTYEVYFREKGKMYDTRLGHDRQHLTNPFRAIVDAGLTVAGCSDSDVMPIDPILGIYAASNHPNVDSRISPYEALAMYTINGAISVFEEDTKGSLELGKDADFLVLSDNPLTVLPKQIKNIHVLKTFKKGKCLYDGDAHD